MTTYLLTWKPKLYPKWMDDIHDSISQINENGFCEYGWSTGSTKNIQPGARVFLMKLGDNPGIVADGWGVSKVYRDTNWHSKAKGKKTNYIKVHFYTILNPEMDEIFSAPLKRSGIYGEQKTWTPQGSGMKLIDNVAEKLEQDWAKFLNRPIPELQIQYADEVEIKNTPPLKVLTEIYRILRDTTLARKIKEIHNYTCQVCGLKPIQLPNGNFYAEAHHLMPLGKHGGLDIEGNIICVCPNCHVKLDYGVIKLEIEKLQTHKSHKVDESFVKYHNKEIYNKTSYK